ncbi:hypothetical protein OIO90_006262 [Microbotryomycetes sp. JL221]|nr:hypothetical protein OIO90_006262 [Microbotryomycetes sp. JL221]
MRFSVLVAVSSMLAAVSAHDHAHRHNHVRRQQGTSSPQADSSTSYLPAIIASATDECRDRCTDISRAVGSCISQGSGNEVQIAMCACSQQTLGVIKHCVSCVNEDPDNKEGTKPLSYYNGFVNQCISLSVASPNDLTSVPGQAMTTASALTSLDLKSASTIAPAVLTSALDALTATSSASARASSLADVPSGMSKATITITQATSLGANAAASGSAVSKPSSASTTISRGGMSLGLFVISSVLMLVL